MKCDASGVGCLSKWFGFDMYEEYQGLHHALLTRRTMESPPQELDEEKLEAAIAGVLNEQRLSDEQAAASLRAEFPSLLPQKDVTAQTVQKDTGLTAKLRQKWAELSGAA